ncbi:MAG: EamA family transporter RarD [Gammaproteobacteria bacterium]|nr:MAG: EamA family transporter RarD [Gammaproteobacteria bacterium]
MSASDSTDRDETRSGIVAGLIAYSLWGVFPVYFKIIESVAPTEVLAHRIVWAVPFGALILLFRRQWPEVRRALTDRTTVSWLALSALFITVNWFIYIWAVQNARIFETSLGYYINPLMYVFVGVLFFGERLRSLQLAAVIFASVGVLVLTLSGGTFPWVAISLAVFFTAYGVIRKRVAIGAMPGLFVETVLLFPFAMVWMTWLLVAGQASFSTQDMSLAMLLLAAGPITVVPLLLFAVAARRLPLTMIGFMQFLAPTLQLLTGIYYGEKLTTAHQICFGLIWVAVILFSVDAIRAGRKKAA